MTRSEGRWAILGFKVAFDVNCCSLERMGGRCKLNSYVKGIWHMDAYVICCFEIKALLQSVFVLEDVEHLLFGEVFVCIKWKCRYYHHHRSSCCASCSS